ncbi:MAG: thioredoxin-like domain-containing protein [Luteibaculaceae bacterium]
MKIFIGFMYLLASLNTACAESNPKAEPEVRTESITNELVNNTPQNVKPSELKFKVKGVKPDETIYLAKYLGKKLYYNDTTVVGKKGEIAFKTKARGGGVYSLVLPGPKLFEVVIADSEDVVIELDTLDLVGKANIVKSANNKVYYDYLKFIENQKQKLGDLQTKKKAAVNPAEAKEFDKLIEVLDNEVKTYLKKLTSENKDLFISKLIKMSDAIDIPDAPVDANGVITDSLFQYRFYRDNFFMHVDLRDDRTASTPLFGAKLEQYITQIVPQSPDSIVKYADKLVSRVNGMPDLTKLTVSFITDHYGRSQIMGMDKVFVHMVENHYMTQNFEWIDKNNLEKLTERALKLKPTLIGTKAPALYLAEPNSEKYVHLYSLQADYTILYFWDPTCGHCKKVTPKLAQLLNKPEFKDRVKVYAVNTDIENDNWIKYLEKNDLSNFVNVSDMPKRPDPFRSVYDIFSTPKVFVLDNEKKILAKQIDVEQVEDLLNFFMKNPKN